MTAVSELVVGASLEGERIDRIVALVAGCTRAAASALVDGGHVQIDGAVVTSRHRRVTAGELVELTATPPEATQAEVVGPEPEVVFEVVYDDAAIIVVDKPAGLVVHPGAGNTSGTLVSGLVARYPELGSGAVGDPHRPGIVHRLDKQTSGLLVVARTPESLEALFGQLQRREMGRTYLALVEGAVSADAGVIDAPIGRAMTERTRMAVEASGREARTHYDVLERFDGSFTLVEARLETGRTHQIRVHFAAIGHPVAGDRTYRGYRRVEGLDRPFLHAARLDLVHPATGEPMHFSSPLPQQLEDVLTTLRR
jgi:23S rRNA pseudouridine1911/1915/1917 synthase